MNFIGEFKQLGSFDVSELKKKISDFSAEDWRENQYRQKEFDVHKKTQTIHFIFDDDFRHENPTRQANFYTFQDQLLPLMNYVAGQFNSSEKGRWLAKQYGPGYFIRVIMVNLPAGASITPHSDNGYSLTHCHRIHVPVITNEQVSFTVGGVQKKLQEGEVWEINNTKEHSVANDSDQDRIHVIMDWVMPGEMVMPPDDE